MRRMAILVVLLSLASVLAFGQASKQMIVTFKQTQVRATPSQLGKILGTLEYGVTVTVVAEQSGWGRVKLPSGEGWVSLQALTPAKAASGSETGLAGKGFVSSLRSGSKDTTAGVSSDEVALAGKGMDEVERQYRQERTLDYTWVDRMEKSTVSPEAILAFLQQGSLDTSLGGGR